jgi:hypothetical protein
MAAGEQSSTYSRLLSCIYVVLMCMSVRVLRQHDVGQRPTLTSYRRKCTVV